MTDPIHIPSTNAPDGSSASLPKPARKQRWQRRFAFLDTMPHDPVTGRLLPGPMFKRPQSLAQFTDSFRLQWLMRPALGFIFGPFYYLYLGMRHKAGIILAYIFLITAVANLFQAATNIDFSRLLNLAGSIFCAHMVARDYYSYVRYGDKFWMDLSPRWAWLQPTWIKSTRGVWLAIGGAFLISLVVALATEGSDTSDVDANTQLMDDMDGVWRMADGTVVEIDLVPAPLLLTASGLGKFDCRELEHSLINNLVVLNCVSSEHTERVTLCKIVTDAKKNTFQVSISWNDSAPENMDYLRPVVRNSSN